MRLIIAEKPSLARNIAAAIGDPQKQDGFLSTSDYLVTWAFGHLFALEDIEHYQNKERGEKWCLEGLPCFPEIFDFTLRHTDGKNGTIDAGVQKQFRIIEQLCNRDDVEAVINAGDADREGEIIVRLCIAHALHGDKPLLRLWLPDQTPQTVRAALQDMRPESEYDDLAAEGFARTYMDWLYGVNLTRYATLKTGTLLRVGRVIVPIVKAIYDRDMAITHFQSETYYTIASRAETQGAVVELNSKLRFPAHEAHRAPRAAAFYNSVGATVTEVKSKKDTLAPGKLFSLTKLQNVLGKKYKMSMQESLEIVQKLYEAGYLTYPRTNSEYLATAEKDKIRKILQVVSSAGYPVAFREGKTIFDDSKIESHSALTPTYRFPDKTALNEKERLVYGTVLRRFVAVFCAEPCVCMRSEIHIAVDRWEEFVLRGTMILEKGWTKYEDAAVKDKLLPPLKKGDSVNVDFQSVQKQTSPPRHYTIETLNNYLKNPFREDKAAADLPVSEGSENDTEEYRAVFEGLELGTEATRTGIIDHARQSGYIDLRKDVYTLLPGGAYLIESLVRLHIQMDKYKTSALGQALKKVYHGKMTVQESLALVQEEIAAVFAPRVTSQEESDDIGVFGEVVGACPQCGGQVRRTIFGYGCSQYKDKNCKFSIGQTICGRVINPYNARQLLQQGRTNVLQGFTSKAGRPFQAALCLRDNKVQFDFQKTAGSSEE